jgi:hypothetical protein
MNDRLFSDRLDLIRNKLLSLRAIDTKLRVPGAGGEHGHCYREDPVLDDVGLCRIERAYGVSFPDEIRAFLTQVHGGGAGPGYGLRIPIPAVPQLRTTRPFPHDNHAAESILSRRKTVRFSMLPLVEGEGEDDRAWPQGPGFIPIAHHGCGMFSVLIVTGEQRGKVWFCDMGWIPEHSSTKQFGFLDWYEDWLDRHLPRQT